MRKFILIATLLFTGSALFAQKKITTSGTVAFDATTGFDDLAKAENKTVIGAINTTTGVIQFEANVKNFTFGNPTMQGHFNGTKWMDSEQFPKMTFNGKVADLSKVNFTKDGTYTVTVAGDLTVRGVTKSFTTTGTIAVKGSTVNINAAFKVKCADFGIANVSIESGKVSREPTVTVSAELK
ncbi:MAG TPA: YceI family protein [Chitinophagaceae bacterium]|nr:YceI family protein [Chitinophagaceae bacterium]